MPELGPPFASRCGLAGALRSSPRMKLKIVLIGVAAFALLAYAHFKLNSGPSSRGSLEPEPNASASAQADRQPDKAREAFRVGFLPVT